MNHNNSESLSPVKLPPVNSARLPHKQNIKNSHLSYKPFNNKTLQSCHSKSTHQHSRSLAASSVFSYTEPEEPIIRSFRQKNNPFDQGYTRADKIRYQGSPEKKNAHTRLHQYCTIASLSHSGLRQPLFSETTKVSGIHNLRQTFQKNNLMQQIVEEQEFLKTNPKLMQNIESLWKMNLLSDKNIKNNSLSKNQYISYVYNDFHSRSTNPGYARNDNGGAFFTR